MFHKLLSTLAVLFLLTLPVAAKDPAQPLKAGIIGLDTSHVVAFAGLLNGPKAEGVLADVRIVAAYPGGSPDVKASAERVAGYTKDLREKYGVEIVDSIDALLEKVDVVFLESVDGRPHLDQVKPVFKAHKPVFIDKPVAGSLADAIQIFQLARESSTPCFSSSSLRFSPGILAMRSNPKVGKVQGCDAYGPCSLEEHHPDLFWYGVHGVESLFTIMGTGCVSVSRTHTKGTDLVTGTWKDGRVGTFRGIRAGKSGYGATVFGSEGIAPSGGYGGYEPLVIEICKFFKSHEPPVSAAETIEIFAFMEAADESKRQGGAPVMLQSVLTKARAAADKASEAPSFARREEVIYGRKYGTALTMDVFTPRRANGAAVILVVSGGFVSSHDGIRLPLAKPFLDRGYTVFAVVHGCQPRYQVPEIVQDMNRAVRFIRYHAKDYGIDPNRIGVTGGSAGGHLSLILGTAGSKGDPKASDPVDRESSRVQAVACFFPPTDFLNYGGPGIEKIHATDYDPRFRASFDYRELEPKARLWERVTDSQKLHDITRGISPIYFINSETPPTLILHGDQDKLVPLQQSESFVDKLKSAGVEGKLVVKKGGGHGWLDLVKDVELFADWFDRHLAKAL